MNGQDLKNSILQLAIQGKLVEQREEEGTAKELLEQIKAEIEQQIKEEKIKKKNKLPEIKEDEIPFDIPDSWEWVRLGDLCNYGKCNSIAAKNVPHDAWLLDLEDIEKDSGKILNKKRRKDVKSTSSKHIFKRGDVLYSKLRPYLNKVVIACEDGYSTSEILPLDFGEHIYNRYSQTVLMSPYFIDYTVKCSYGVKMPRLGTTDGQMAVFPLPPLEEQKRIVAKIEELMPYVEKYNNAYSEVDELNKKFPEGMQKSILQYAIQGKLVEQRKDEDTAEELYQQIQEEKKKLVKENKIKKNMKLPEITEDEIPFDIPENWKWTRFSEVIDVRDGTHDTPAYVSKGYPLITGKDFYNGYFELSKTRYVSEKDYKEISKRSKVEVGDILFSMIGGNIGSMILIEPENYFEMAIKNVALFKQYTPNMIMSKYLMYYLKSQVSKMKANSSGGAQAFVSLTVLRNYLIPLPPLEEQKRIVHKIEELLPYTKQLVK
ncbi:MAG: restriction endonuclease subunit S [Bacillus sp. (in: Bacteria)]|nr:restriction endonuclease subunit S [Bacillus sp. (in: firmicutes)]